MMLVARIDYALTRGLNWLTTCLIERARGYDSYRAGDYLAADQLADAEAEQEVAEPRPAYIGAVLKDGTIRVERLEDITKPSSDNLSRAHASISKVADSLAEILNTSADPTPPAETDPAAGGPPDDPAAGSPTVPAGLIESEARTPAGLGVWQFTEDEQCLLGLNPGEMLGGGVVGPPVSTPVRPTPGQFAAVAVREVLAEHLPDLEGDGTDPDSEVWCWHPDAAVGTWFTDWQDWRNHVAAEIERRIDAATNSQAQQPR